MTDFGTEIRRIHARRFGRFVVESLAKGIGLGLGVLAVALAVRSCHP